jgi:ribosome-binding protein aMBF1 (putative translation factor)
MTGGAQAGFPHCGERNEPGHAGERKEKGADSAEKTEELMLTNEQRRKYEDIIDLAREELDQLDKELAAEVARAKERLHELQEAKRAVKLIYDGACSRLGAKGELTLQSADLAELDKHA